MALVEILDFRGGDESGEPVEIEGKILRGLAPKIKDQDWAAARKLFNRQFPA